MRPLSLVFAGTPEFGLPCLEALASQHNIKAIYTQPDRPAGRGRHLQASAVKEWAEKQQLPICQPLNFKDPAAVEQLAALAPDVMVVIAYGLILPQAVLNIPRLGCINVHASLLPRWRGASPIQHALLHGDQESGITIMQMEAGLDTGPMLVSKSLSIGKTETAAQLHDRLSILSVSPLLNTLEQLATGTTQPIVQDNVQATYAHKINKDDAGINWRQSAQEIDQQIRAYNPWPIAYTKTQDALLRVYQAQVVAETTTHAPGTILSLDKQGLLVATGEHCLLIERFQFPGAKAMAVADWLHAKRDQLHVNLVLQ